MDASLMRTLGFTATWWGGKQCQELPKTKNWKE